MAAYPDGDHECKTSQNKPDSERLLPDALVRGDVAFREHVLFAGLEIMLAGFDLGADAGGAGGVAVAEPLVERAVGEAAGCGPAATKRFFRASTCAPNPSKVRAPSNPRSPGCANTTSSTVSNPADRTIA